MSKIKVVQMMVAASTNDAWTQLFLDTKGRVWSYGWQPIEGSGVAGVINYAYKWVQIELPEEPGA